MQKSPVTRPLISLFLSLSVALLAACGTPSAAPSRTPVPASSASPVTATTTPSTNPQPTSAPETTAVVEPTVAPTAKPAEAGTSRSMPLPLGTEIKFKSWALTITAAIRGKDALTAIQKANQFNGKPAKGNEYLLVTLKDANISTEKKAQNVDLALDLGATGDRNILYRRAAVVTPKKFEGDLFPKGMTEGQVAFELPSDEKNVMLRVGENFSFDEDALRFVAIDKDAKASPPADLVSINATDSGKSKDAPAKVGDTITTDEWQATVMEVKRGADAAAMIKAANQFNEPATAGQEYIAVKLHVRYIGKDKPDKTQSIDSSFLKVTGEKNVVYDRPSVVPPKPSLDAVLFPGGEAEGWAVVSVATGEKGLVLIFEPLLSFSSDAERFISIE